MNEHLLLRLEKAAPDMSKSHKAIARYIISYFDKAAYMTALKLGETVGVSEATVVRFAKRFGYEGYPQLQKAMQELTRNKLTSLQRMDVTGARIGDGDIMRSVLNRDIEMIRRTTELTSEEQFNRAVDLLCSARRIYVIGTRSASSLAGFMSYYLSLIFDQVKLIDPSNESTIFEQMLRITEEDAVVGISFPRYSRKAVKAMRFAADSGAKTIALTDSVASPLAERADCLLLAQSDMASIVDSLVAPMSLINALLVATAIKQKDELTEQFGRLERIWDEYDVYEKESSEK